MNGAFEETGGARRNRTADLLNAIQALSQLSYGPGRRPFLACGSEPRAALALNQARETGSLGKAIVPAGDWVHHDKNGERYG